MSGEAPVIGWERRVLLRHYLEQGLTVTEMARELGISRQTVYRWLRSGELDRDVGDVRYGPRPPVPTKLDPYKGIIRERLDAYPELTAVRLLAEIRAAGYLGGYTQLKEYVRTVRPRPPEEPEVRFETAPGVQAQVDFAHFRFPWGRRYALLVVLGFSRLLWLRFYRRQDMRTLIRKLEAAFGFFGGVPREVLFDPMKSVILRDLWPEGGRLIENAEFLRFCADWGFRPRACRPYRAKTKGKVERPIRYVRRSLVYGREFAGDADLNAQAEWWLGRVANVRVHGTTGERPTCRFEREERAALGPLAHRPYHSLALPAEVRSEPRARRLASGSVPPVDVERRPLAVYARIAGGVR
ncbi:MAG TPA: IS21 family transposase [Gemmatimonadota bacterium]|nr:IS21 family transposase [Gemmatimonadota bacterium]